MASIDDVVAREILDSRGNPTVEVEIVLDDGPAARAATGDARAAHTRGACVRDSRRAAGQRRDRREA